MSYSGALYELFWGMLYELYWGMLYELFWGMLYELFWGMLYELYWGMLYELFWGMLYDPRIIKHNFIHIHLCCTEKTTFKSDRTQTESGSFLPNCH